MARKMFVNLPVTDLVRTKAFYAALGFTFNPQFTNDMAACMIIGPDSCAMLLRHEFFGTFTKKAIADAHATTEVLVALSCETKAEVDAMLAQAIAAGGREPRDPQDHGFMYARSFEDPDGHIWEPFWMDPAHVQG
jgi:uncharacterized protein